MLQHPLYSADSEPSGLYPFGASNGIYWGSSLWMILMLVQWWHPDYRSLTRFLCKDLQYNGSLLGQVSQQRWWLHRKLMYDDCMCAGSSVCSNNCPDTGFCVPNLQTSLISSGKFCILNTLCFFFMAEMFWLQLGKG